MQKDESLRLLKSISAAQRLKTFVNTNLFLLRNFESDLELALFKRTSQGITSIRDGAVLIGRARRVETKVVRFEQEASELSGQRYFAIPGPNLRTKR